MQLSLLKLMMVNAAISEPLPGKTSPQLMRKVLIVAYHYPPQTGSSGHLRALKFARYLPENGWSPTVLTVHPRAYERVDDCQLADLPAEVKVLRCFALDAQRHLSFRGRYSRYAALPDRWVTWCLGAVPAGLHAIFSNKIDVILTTFPVPSAVLIGYLLHRLTGKPWIADFRDSMTEEDYPRDPLTRRVLRWLEKKAVKHASRLLFTAPSARRMYLERYPELPADRCLLLSNGYDEEDFTSMQAAPAATYRTGPLRLLHSGLIYPEERNPLPFFRALARLKSNGKVSSSVLSVELRASGNEGPYQQVVNQLDIADLVRFLPSLSYRAALEESHAAGALLLLQAGSCDHQIPAKAYEYLRLGKPILALTTHRGDTAALLNECGGATIVDIADEESIYRALPDFLSSVQGGHHSLPDMSRVAAHSRRSRTKDLSRYLSEVVDKQHAPATLAKIESVGARS
jgi:glycosyltransferase involved in cell wall biosynthesis